MAKKGILIFFALLLVGGIGIVVYVGIQPRPIPKIKLSFFENPAKMAQAINLRLHEEIKAAPLLAFGYQPEKPEQLEVLREFLRGNQDQGWRYETVVIEDNLPPASQLGSEFERGERINMKDNISVLAEGLKTALQQGRRVILIMPSVYSSQVVSSNVMDQLVKNYQLPIMAISVVELLTSREQEKNLSLPCLVAGADETGTGALGCAILQASRSIYRKKLEPDKRPGMMDQRGAHDYLVFY